MKAVLLDGKGLAARLRGDMFAEVAHLTKEAGRPPCLAVVLVGEDPASHVYVRNKVRACEKVGILSRRHDLPIDSPANKVRALIEAINADPSVDGLLVQLPLPAQLDASDVRAWIDPTKDVDGLHAENQGLLASGTPRFIPCTPAGCLELLRANSIPTTGRQAVVLGRSLIVGRPMSILLSSKGVDATVTLTHSRSENLPELCATADILVAAAGVPQLVQADWIKPGAAVLDVGIHRIEDASAPKGSRLVGDVSEGVGDIAGWLSPVPGGVGPMTIAMLLRNTIHSFELCHGLRDGSLR